VSRYAMWEYTCYQLSRQTPTTPGTAWCSNKGFRKNVPTPMGWKTERHARRNRLFYVMSVEAVIIGSRE
jgi:hypothetical protein